MSGCERVCIQISIELPTYILEAAPLPRVLRSPPGEGRCQYEALKYTSFPVATLAKSAKVVPVMAMGRLLHGHRHSWADYGSASVMVGGIALFALSGGGGGGSGRGPAGTTASGVVLLTLYLFFDAFQSQWQSGLFRRQKVSQLEMMRGVNLFGVLFSMVSLQRAGQLFPAVRAPTLPPAKDDGRKFAASPPRRDAVAVWCDFACKFDSR